MRIRKGLWVAPSLASICYLLVLSPALSEPRQIWPPWPEASLGNYRWNQPIWPELRTVNEDSAAYAESWSGYSLRRDSLTTALPVVIPGGIVDARSRLAVETGAVRFWVAPNWSSLNEKGEGTGPGHYARLLELVNWGGAKPQTHWSLYVSEDGNAMYFSGVGKGGATDFLKVPIAFEAGEWWAVTVCYSPSNSALWLNDQLVAEGEGVAAATSADAASFGLVIGSDIGAANPAEAQFDDLTVFDYWPGDKQQAAYYKAVKKRAMLGPVGTEEEEQAKQELVQTMMESEGPPPVPGEGGGGEGEGGVSAQGAYDYPSNMLWLEITGVSNNLAYLIVHGTVEDVPYEILSREALTNTAWVGEGIVVGAAGQDWTPTTVTVGTRTNNLFLWARSWADSDGDGLPDWYEDEVTNTDPNNPDTGNTGVSDGYKDSDNDGWTNLQEYQNGTNPNSFNTPAAPDGLVVSLVSTGLHANLTWQPARGAVTGYTIERSFTNVSTQVSSSSTSFADNSHMLPTGLYFTVPNYRIQANYAAGNSDWGPWTSSPESLAPEASILSGNSGQVLVLAAMSTPAKANALRSGQWYTGIPEYSITNVDLPVTAFTNGIATMPEPFATLTSTGYWYLQWVHTNGVVSAAISVGLAPTIPFWDGRQQLKQNLQFLLRAATINYSFGYKFDDGENAPYFIESPTSYAYAGLYETDDPFGLAAAYVDQFRPFDENHRYRNFAFSATNLHTFGDLTTGVYWDSAYVVTLDYPPVHRFSPPANPQAIPALLSTAESQWLYWTEFIPFTDSVFTGGWDEMGISYQSPNFVMATGARNVFGLPYQSVKQAWGNNASYTSTLNAGGSTTAQDGFFYPGAAQPLFQTAGYYFGRPWVDWLPGHTAFSPTNATPLLITSVGQPMQIAGYAKLAVTNGYSGTYGFLGQYFEKAYTVGTNGMATTNLAGLLSPYGDFFPTEPGPAALVTLPDLETGERGTCMVHVIKLQLDVNHDGVMDLSFTGPDNTSANRPFRFWMNNDRDEQGAPGTLDKDLDVGSNQGSASDYVFGEIHCQRNLEDFARLWVEGLPSVFPSGVTATLGFRNAHGDPKINLYYAYDSLGGTNYLFDTNGAAAQFTKTFVGSQLVMDYAKAVGTVNANTSYGLPVGIVSGELLQKYFLFEGSGEGGGELVLTVRQGTNIVAETSQWVEIRDIKEMYEWAVVTNVIQRWPEMVEQLPTSGFTVANSPASAVSEANEIAVFVHGWRMPEFEARVFAETMFKRLYWQGFQGRFAALRWPTRSADTDPWQGLVTYNRSEHIAFASGTGAAGYLNGLRSRFPDHRISVCAHSMGGVVMMEALKELADSSQSPIDNCVLMQVAVPAHCYDGSVTNFPTFMTAEQSVPTPDVYRNYGAGITNALRGDGVIVNFFSPVDFALAFGAYGTEIGSWQFNEGVVMDDGTNGFVTMKPNTWLGYYHTNATGSLLRTNQYNTSLLSILWNGYYLSPPHPPIRAVTNTFEVMPFIARPRSKAVGAQAGVQGQILGGEINLQDQLGFTGGTFDHSGQFNRNIQDSVVHGFYFELRRKLFPE